MILKDLIPLFATLLGGILAVVGGFISNLLLSRIAVRRDKKKFHRESLEQIYLVSGELVRVLLAEVDMLIGFREREDKPIAEIRNELMNKLAMLITFYHPKLATHLQSLKKINDEFSNNICTVANASTQEHFSKLRDSYAEFSNAREKLVKELIYLVPSTLE